MTHTTSLYETAQTLFDGHPAAVRIRNRSGTARSMILRFNDDGAGVFFILRRPGHGDYYSLRGWPGGAIADIEPDSDPGGSESITREVAEILARGVPVPNDGSMFAWQHSGTVTTLINFFSQYGPETPEPSWAMMPLEGLPEEDWLPFPAGQVLDDGFWDHVQAGNIVNLGPLIAATPGAAFWAQPACLSYGCCAVARTIDSPDGWTLPRGRYVYWQSLRAGEPVPPLDAVLAGDVTDLAPRFQAGG